MSSSSESEIETTKNNPIEKDVFGSESDSDSVASETKKKPANLDFGSSDSDASSIARVDIRPSKPSTVNRNILSSGDESDSEKKEDNEKGREPEETKIAVDFPLIKADLGKKVYLVKMPNFLSVETRPFNPALYDDELDNAEFIDEEGRSRMKLKVENTIRWRSKEDIDIQSLQEDFDPSKVESNARIVRWSDNSMSLYLGTEIFDMHTLDIQSDYNHLFIREGSGLQGQTTFAEKLSFRPHSTDSFTHRKITKSLIDKSSKQHQVKLLPTPGSNPESNRSLLIKQEEEKLRASLRMESQKRRMKEKQVASAAQPRKRATGFSIYEDDDGPATSEGRNKPKNRRSQVFSSEEDSLSDISEDLGRKKKKNVIESDEDDE